MEEVSGHSSPLSGGAKKNSAPKLHRLHHRQSRYSLPNRRRNRSRDEFAKDDEDASQLSPALPPVRTDSSVSLPAIPTPLMKRSWTKGSTSSPTSSSASLSTNLTDGLNSLRGTGSQILKFPFLPPIQDLPSTEDRDKFSKSKLLRYRFAREQQKRLLKLATRRALKQSGAVARILEEEEEDEEENDGDDVGCHSMKHARERRQKLRHEKAISVADASVAATPLSSERIDNILRLLPKNLTTRYEDSVAEMLVVVKRNYKETMKTIIVGQMTGERGRGRGDIKRRVGRNGGYEFSSTSVSGLLEDMYEGEEGEDEDRYVPPKELDFSSPWRVSYRQTRKKLGGDFLAMHRPELKNIVQIGLDALEPITLLDEAESVRNGGDQSGGTINRSVRVRDFVDDIVESVENTKEELRKSWYPPCLSVFADKSVLKGLNRAQKEKLFGCVDKIMSAQLEDLLKRSLEKLVTLIGGGKVATSPMERRIQFRMEIILDDNESEGGGGDICVYPSKQEFKDMLMRIVRKIAGIFVNDNATDGAKGRGMGFASVRDWLSGDENKRRKFIDASLTDDTLREMEERLERVCRDIYAPLEEQVEAIRQKYDYIIDGTLEEKQHQFENESDFTARNERLMELKDLDAEVATNIPDECRVTIVGFGNEELSREKEDPAPRIILLRLDDLKENLKLTIAEFCARLIAKQRAYINDRLKKVIGEYENYESRSKSIPQNVEEFIQVGEYMEGMQEEGLHDLKEETWKIWSDMDQFMRHCPLNEKEMELFASAISWPKATESLHETHLIILDSKRQFFSKQIVAKNNQFLSALKNVRMKVEGFDDYLEEGLIHQCATEFKIVKKKMELAEKTAEMAKKETSVFSLPEPTELIAVVEEVKGIMEPFGRVLTVCLKFLSLEKAFLDGALIQLNPEEVKKESERLENEMERMLETLKVDQGEKDVVSIRVTILANFRESLMDLRQTSLPLITILRNPNYKDHHIAEIERDTNVDLNYGLTMRKILQSKLGSDMTAKLEAIYLRANKETSIERRCEELMGPWVDGSISFVIEDAAETIQIQSLDTVLGKLEEDSSWLEREMMGLIVSEEVDEVLSISMGNLEMMKSVVRGWKALFDFNTSDVGSTTVKDDFSSAPAENALEETHFLTDGQNALRLSVHLACRSIYKHICKERRIFNAISCFDDEIYSLQEFFLTCV